MEMPLAEVIDRFVIVKLKKERIKTEDKTDEHEHYKKVLEDYKNKGIDIKQEWIERLYDANGKIWDLESDLRKGKEGLLGLEEVGRRAIKIREINKIRISIKNEIVEATGSGFKDIKMNHASQEN
tara:strand:+ start:1747 stop:2121 length:375 start_codon:yes stop_codon:yes gene_type:complete